MVLLWDSPYEEFYYGEVRRGVWAALRSTNDTYPVAALPPQLEDGVHVVRVNPGSLQDTVAGLMADDTKARAIAAQGLDWYSKHLRAQDIKVRALAGLAGCCTAHVAVFLCLQNYWLALLHAYAPLQRFTPKASLERVLIPFGSRYSCETR